jgi:hypothetical protein
VTSDLAPEIEKVNHGQGGAGKTRRMSAAYKFFVHKILTSNLKALKILRGFC